MAAARVVEAEEPEAKMVMACTESPTAPVLPPEQTETPPRTKIRMGARRTVAQRQEVEM